MNNSSTTAEAKISAPPLAASTSENDAAKADSEGAFSPDLATFFKRINCSSAEAESLACRSLNVPSARRDVFPEGDD